MAAELKAQGTEAFKKNDFEEAVRLYGEAIALNKIDHVLYSNRSAAYAGAKKYEEALADGLECVKLKPDFAKGYGRVALSQYHLNKLMDAQKSYQQGLMHDSSSQVLKNGLRDTMKSLRGWFLSVLQEVADAQSVSQEAICELTHELVADGSTSVSFLDAHQKVMPLNLPKQDTLEKHGMSEEDCQLTIAEYDKAYDYEVMTAVQRMMFMPPGSGDRDRAAKLEIATILEVYKFMETQMKKLVEEFNQLPEDTRHSIAKKEREYSSELAVSVAVEASFKIQSEDLSLAVEMHQEQLHGDPAFVECQTELGNLMARLMEAPFVEKASEQASSSESGTTKTSKFPALLGLSGMGEKSCKVGTISVLGLVALFGFIRWRASTK